MPKITFKNILIFLIKTIQIIKHINIFSFFSLYLFSILIKIKKILKLKNIYMKNFLFLFSIFLIISKLTFSQSNDDSWRDLPNDPESNFFKTVQIYNDYWNGRDKSSQKGWKQFERWRYNMESKVYPDGSFPEGTKVRDEFEKYYAKNASKSLAGNWTALGAKYMPDNGTTQPNGLGRVNAIAFHPTNPNIIFVGAPVGGLWKSSDGGLT